MSRAESAACRENKVKRSVSNSNETTNLPLAVVECVQSARGDRDKLYRRRPSPWQKQSRSRLWSSSTCHADSQSAREQANLRKWRRHVTRSRAKQDFAISQSKYTCRHVSHESIVAGLPVGGLQEMKRELVMIAAYFGMQCLAFVQPGPRNAEFIEHEWNSILWLVKIKVCNPGFDSHLKLTTHFLWGRIGSDVSAEKISDRNFSLSEQKSSI